MHQTKTGNYFTPRKICSTLLYLAATGDNNSGKVAHIRSLAMSHKHSSLLHAIFHDPVSGNIHW
ncbi:MAG: hypothetical protein Q8S05_06250, partial [Sulfuricella sp.]|nr:hypothetical protein [Sulfuricella sp.]